MKWIWIFAAIGIITIILFVWPMIYGKQLPDIFSNQENAATLGTHHWNLEPNNTFPTAKGQTDGFKQVSVVCFTTTSPTQMFNWNWCVL